MSGKNSIARISIFLLYSCAVLAAERPSAEIQCTPAGQQFVYDCTIRLTGRKSGTPIPGAKLMLGAAMPSMPMAHNVRPVQVQESGQTGHYNARIELEMYGEWVLKIEVSGPVRDKLIHKKYFGKDTVSDVK